jgi:tetratricopeptide (TPR) repeat protein
MTEADDFPRLLAELARTPDRAPDPVELRHFRVLGKLGQGGMGAVYKAHDTKLDRVVALKRVAGAAVDDARSRERLLREARAAAALSHPGLVAIYAIEEIDGIDYIVMELVDGEPLDAVIARGSLEPSRAVALAAEIGDALACAHAAGLVHRDIKPSNVMVTTAGRAKVLDFGVVKSIAPVDGTEPTQAPITAAGGVIGTVPYMAPEQLAGEAVDARADVWALGCVLYEALTARRAFAATDLAGLVVQITQRDPAPPSAIAPAVPRALDGVVLRALAKDRARRFASAADLATALRGTVAAVPAAPIAPAADAAAMPTLVGRDAELAELVARWHQAAGGRGAFALVTGDAGIGKTELVDALLRRAPVAQPGAIVGRGRCLEQFGAREAYLPLFDLLEDLLAGPHATVVRETLLAAASTWALQLRAASATAGMSALARDSLGATKERMVRELGDVIATLAEHAPLLLVLEDVHWAEPSTVDVLRYAAQRLDRQRALVVCTLRAGDVDVPGHPMRDALVGWRTRQRAPEIALGPLGARAIAAWLDARFAPNDFAPDLAVAIHARSDGQPLFASAMIEWLLEQKILHADARGWHAAAIAADALGIPDNLRGMLRAKLDMLAADERRLVELGAVQGVEFVSTVLADQAAADEIALDEQLTALARTRRLIRPLGEDALPDGELATRWRFAHAVYRDVVYADLPAKRRAALHRDVAASLRRHHADELASIAGVLAVHCEQARDFAAATAHRLQAGDNAMALLAAVEADRHYAAALADAERLPAGDRDRASLPALRQRAVAALALGRSDEAVAALEDALARAERVADPALVGAAHVALADALITAHRLDGARPHVEAALALAERTGLDGLRVDALGVAALDRLVIGELDACGAALDRIPDPGPLALHLRGLLHYFWSDYAAAERAFARAAEDNERALADGLLLMESRMFRGLALGNAGRVAAALALLEATLDQARRNDNQAMAARVGNSIGWLHRELGAVERAIEYDLRAAEAGRAAGESEAEANALVNLSEDRLASGAAAPAAEPFARVAELAAADAWLRFRYGLRLAAARARQHVAAGALADADAAVAALLDDARAQRAGKYVAIALELEARVARARGDVGGARRAVDDARAALDATPCPLVAWKLDALAASLAADAGDAAAAATARAHAAATAQAIASGLPAAARETFLAAVASAC